MPKITKSTLDMTFDMSPEERRVVKNNREINKKEQDKERAKQRNKKDTKRERG
jgi:hypothetical protein